MARLITDNTRRFCSRCGESLTDPASREHGQGPVCRRKDNHLYAKLIPANYAVAVVHALAVKADMLAPECVVLWSKTQKTIMRRAEKAQNASTDIHQLKLVGQDLRDTVRNLDFMCSWSHPSHEVRNHLVEMIGALGYVGLAAVIGGKASTSPAKVWFDANASGRILLECLGNTSGWSTMGKIPGVIRPRYRGDRTPYSVPAGQHEAFLAAVRTHWPMYEGDLDAIKAEAVAYVAAHPPVAPAAPAAPVYAATMTARTMDFTLKFDWRPGANMYGLVNALKAGIPSTDRRYDPNTKMWSFKFGQEKAVWGILRNSGIFTAMCGPGKPNGSNPTPEGLYNGYGRR